MSNYEEYNLYDGFKRVFSHLKNELKLIPKLTKSELIIYEKLKLRLPNRVGLNQFLRQNRVNTSFNEI